MGIPAEASSAGLSPWLSMASPGGMPCTHHAEPHCTQGPSLTTGRAQLWPRSPPRVWVFQQMSPRVPNSPQHQPSLDIRLHFVGQVLHIGLQDEHQDAGSHPGSLWSSRSDASATNINPVASWVLAIFLQIPPCPRALPFPVFLLILPKNMLPESSCCPTHLQVMDSEGIFIDVGGVSAHRDASDGRQVPAVAPHRLHNEDAALGARG